MTHRSRTLALALTGALATSACGEIVSANSLGDPAHTLGGSGTVAEPAVLIFHGDTGHVRAPVVVERGDVFAVGFRTFGGGCTREVGPAAVQIVDGEVVIRPHNRRYHADGCFRDIKYLDHRVTVRITQRGRFLIRVLGRQQGRNVQGYDAPAELARWVEVR